MGRTRRRELRNQGSREEEVIKAIKKLKKGKTAGNDQISGEMLKRMGKIGVQFISSLYNRCWNEGDIPEEWKMGIVIPIFKKEIEHNARTIEVLL